MVARAKSKAKVDSKRQDPTEGDVTGAFWRQLLADPKRLKFWRNEAVRAFRRALVSDPMPGIWSKYTARIELGMAVFQALERRDSSVPQGFLDGEPEPNPDNVDCYWVAEQLVNDKLIAEIDAKKGSRLREVAKRKPSR